MTVFVFITYDNLQNIQAERSLPLGVTEIELTNWTKTREPEEIGDGEKKMNSHSDRAELNEGISWRRLRVLMVCIKVGMDI